MRSAFATISSEGGMSGFMVRNQLRKQRQASQVRHLFAKISDFSPWPANKFNHLHQFLIQM